MYIDAQGLVDRFGKEELIQLTDRVNALRIDTVVINRAILDACAEIDSYLSGAGYVVPVVVVPSVLVRIAGNIVRYRLYDDTPSGGDRKTEWRLRYEDELKVLDLIRKGDLPISAPKNAAAAGGSYSGAYAVTQIPSVFDCKQAWQTM